MNYHDRIAADKSLAWIERWAFRAGLACLAIGFWIGVVTA